MLTLRTTKGSELTWVELDQNFTFLEGLINDVQLTINNIVTINTIQTITGQKDFSQLIKTDGIISRTSTNGGGYIDVNDGQISIGTGLNAADGTPEISIENKGYGMGVIFAPSDGTVFRTSATFNQTVSFNNGFVARSNELELSSATILLGNTGSTNMVNGNPAWYNLRPTNFMGTNGILEGKESWSTDWDTNNIINISKNTMLIKTLGAGAYNFTFKSFSLYQQIANTVSSASIYSKTIKLVLKNTSAATSINWDAKIQWVSGSAPTPRAGTMIVLLELSIGSAGVIEAYGSIVIDNTLQATLVSGTNIKTVNGNSLLGSGDLQIAGGITGLASVAPLINGVAAVGTSTLASRQDHVHPSDTTKQATLVSGTNIKTVNGVSLLGSGDIVIGAGGTGTVVYDTYSTVGRIASYTALPTGYLLCNGQAVSRTTYSTLFAAIGTTYGAGDGSTTFNLPNLTEPTGVVVNTSADLLTSFGPIDYKTTLFMAFSGTRLVILATCGSRAHEITGLTLTPAAEYISYQSPTSINFEICQSGDGSILYIGDGFRNSTGANVMLVNDDGSQSLWSTIDDYIASCSKFKVCYLPNYSSYFVCGGYNWTPSNKTKLITSSVGVTVGEDLPVGLYNHTVTTLADGRVLITGGISSTGSSNGTYILTFTSATVFTVIVSNILPIDLFSHTATLLPDGKVLIIGGSSINDLTGYNDNAYILTITGDTISYSDPIMMPFAVMGHSAILTEFGRVIVAGGMLAGGTINLNYMMLSVTNTNKYIKY